MKRLHKALITIATLASALAQASLDESSSLSYEFMGRLNTPQQKNDSNDSFNLGLKTGMDRGMIRGVLDADLRFLRAESAVNGSLSEAYVEYVGDENKVALGRKHLGWNPEEQFWMLGHIEGQRAFRLLDQKQEGLIGIFHEGRSGSFKTQIVASYFYLPQMNPGMKVENGRVTSTSEWVKLPPTKTVLFDQETNINYTLNRPSNRDVILQKTLGVRSEYSWLEGSLSAFALYKPESNVRLNSDAQYDPVSGAVEVNATPFVNHHAVFGSVLEHTYEGVQMVAGIQSVDPNARLGSDVDNLSGATGERAVFESDGFSIVPRYDREDFGYLSAGVKSPLASARVHYLHYFSEHNKGRDDLYSETVKWKRAIGIEGSYDLLEELKITGSLRYDLERKDNLLSLGGFYSFSRNFQAALELELLQSPLSESYWSAYRANDAIYTSVIYHF
jgi:hypothetical protein